MKLDADRLRNMSTVRGQFAAVLDEAGRGQITHVMRDGQVAAHIVPTDALVVRDTRMLQSMVASVARGAIDAMIAAGGLQAKRNELAAAAGGFGVVLGWLRDADRSRYIEALTIFAALLGHRTGDITGPAVDTVIDWLRPQIGASAGEDTLREDVAEAISDGACREMWRRSRPKVGVKAPVGSQLRG